MPGTDVYGQGVPYPLLSEPPDAQTGFSGLVDALTQRSVMRFTNAADRNATLVSPTAGMIAWLGSEKIWTGWDGTSWVPLGGGTDTDKLTGNTSTTTTTETDSGLAVTLPTITGKEYKITFTGLVRSTVADDRIEVRIRRGTLVSSTLVGAGTMRASVPNSGETLTFFTTDTPGAGSTTWTAWFVRATGTGSVSITASASLPAILTVESM